MASTLHIVNPSDFLVKSVTVFKSCTAEVVRNGTIELHRGANTIVVPDLSSCIDTRSVRVSGLGDATRLVDVICTVQEPSSKFGNNDALRLLQIKLSDLKAEKGIMEQSVQNLHSPYFHSEIGDVEKAAGTLEFFRAEKTRSRVALKELDAQINEVDKAISEEMRKAKKGEANGKMSITLHADEDTTVSLRLAYLVSGVRWDPVYDLHASAKEPKSVALHYRTHIVQTTGEDWTDVKLTLSTTAAQTNTVPSLGIYKIHPSSPAIRANSTLTPGQSLNSQPNGARTTTGAEHEQQDLSERKTKQSQDIHAREGLLSQRQSALCSVGSCPVAMVPTPEAIEKRDSDKGPLLASNVLDSPQASVGTVAAPYSVPTVHISPIFASFQVQGFISIPSDGEIHTISAMPSFNFESVVTRVAVPRVNAQVYLQCKVKNDSEYGLLSGPVRIVLDEGYAGMSTIEDVPPGEEFECTLGVDPFVRISYDNTSQVGYEAARAFGDADKDVTIFTSRTTVRNKHPFAITRLILHDALPLVGSDDKSFKVTLKEPDHLLSASGEQEVTVQEVSEKWKDSKLQRKVRWGKTMDGRGGEKDGKYEWLVPLEAGQEVTLTAVWEVRSSRGVAWHQGVESI